MKQRRYLISGRVQGVWYRQSTVTEVVIEGVLNGFEVR